MQADANFSAVVTQRAKVAYESLLRLSEQFLDGDKSLIEFEFEKWSAYL